jgi:hypothetical protein
VEQKEEEGKQDAPIAELAVEIPQVVQVDDQSPFLRIEHLLDARFVLCTHAL